MARESRLSRLRKPTLDSADGQVDSERLIALPSEGAYASDMKAIVL